MTKKDLQKWVTSSAWSMVSEYTVPWVAASSRYGRELAIKWIDSKHESVATSGWQTYSSLVSIKDDATLDFVEIKQLLERVESSIHQQPNRVRYVMNGFVIAVACYVKPLHPLAVDAAERIGRIQVSLVGSCKLPFAPEAIKKFAARREIGSKRKSAKC